MAFKIAMKSGQGMPVPIMEQELPQEPTAEAPSEELQEAPEEQMAEEVEPEGKGRILLEPEAAGYEGPDQGPFMCGNCVYFSLEGPNTCHFVAGEIDQMGCCNLFKSAGGAEEGEEEAEPEVGMEQPTEEMPVEALEEPPQE
jgi:hypothetical protein